MRPRRGGGPAAARGRLSFRPTLQSEPSARGRREEFRLEIDAGRAALVQPAQRDGPVRLVVLLHGAGGAPERTLDLLRPYVGRHRLLLAAPKSAGRTWDAITGGFGPDVRMIDQLLRRLASAYDVQGCTVGGFSDGASYALSLGIANGDVFDSVVAFSPGFADPADSHGRPRFFLSHGIEDQILPIEVCSRRLVPYLQGKGYDVTYEEFEGGHEVPPHIRVRAAEWLGANG